MLTRAENATLYFFVAPSESADLKRGSYELVAELQRPDAMSGVWDGAARSSPLILVMRDEPVPMTDELKDARTRAFATYHLRRDELEAAEQVLSARLVEAPESVDALAFKGELALRRGNPAAAKAAYLEALDAYEKLHPNASEPPMHLLRRLNELQGDFHR